MLTLNGFTVAENKDEALAHLFDPSAPLCEVTIERKRADAVLFSVLGHAGRLFVVNRHGVLGQASKLPNGRLWYQYTTADPLGAGAVGRDNVRALHAHFFGGVTC